MEFNEAFEAFILHHVRSRTGQSAARIADGLHHAEKLFLRQVWWPVFRSFEGLHPEYAIRDFKDGNRYIDFAYIHPHYRIAIEIDGITTHIRDTSQDQFCDHCQRQNHLVMDRWYVLRFAFKDVEVRPRLCQQAIQQLIGIITSDSGGVLQTMKVTEREIIRYAMGKAKPITVGDVANHFCLGKRAATRYLKRLTDTGWLEPAAGSARIHAYRLHPSRTNFQI